VSVSKAKLVHLKDVEGSLGSVSIGQRAVAVGVKVPRAVLSLEKADRTLVDARVCVRIVAEAHADAETQDLWDGANSLELEAYADVFRISVGVDAIRFRLSFAKGCVDVATLTKLAGCDAKLSLTRSGNAGEDESSEAEAA